MSPSQPTGAPLPDMLGLAPFHPPPELPSLYASQNMGLYHAASLGTNVPQLYYHAPPYPPLNQLGNATWGYGAPPHPGNLQPTTNASNNAPVQMSERQVHVEGAGQLATSVTTLTESRPGRNYPNRQVSEGGMSHSVD